MIFRKRKAAATAAKRYREAMRLVRQGDGADEFIGMQLAREAREELHALGYDIDGTRPDLKPYKG